ncbi:MAG TPA: proton-conducting transporter membrane subunit, partial [Armatimonadota bacterium]|nr:proton-conducting transporter membrane subunit [Armatimonadota bacterium]
FHLWAPDVYEGAWAPVAAYVATCSKAAVLGVVFRYLGPLAVEMNPGMLLGVSAVAVASMIGGNLYALMQRDLRRVLGYSSVAHMGYALVAFIAGGSWGSVALAFYLTGYCITVLAAFAILSVLPDPGGGYRGLARSRPWLAGALAMLLLSLAGMPLTAGFLGKFYLATVGVRAGLWSLLVAMVVANLMGLFVYLRILTALFDEADAGAEEARPSVTIGVLVAVLIALLVWLGTYPAPVLRLLERAVGFGAGWLWISS